MKKLLLLAVLPLLFLGCDNTTSPYDRVWHIGNITPMTVYFTFNGEPHTMAPNDQKEIILRSTYGNVRPVITKFTGNNERFQNSYSMVVQTRGPTLHEFVQAPYFRVRVRNPDFRSFMLSEDRLDANHTFGTLLRTEVLVTPSNDWVNASPQVRIFANTALNFQLELAPNSFGHIPPVSWSFNRELNTVDVIIGNP